MIAISVAAFAAQVSNCHFSYDYCTVLTPMALQKWHCIAAKGSNCDTVYAVHMLYYICTISTLPLSSHLCFQVLLTRALQLEKAGRATAMQYMKVRFMRSDTDEV